MKPLSKPLYDMYVYGNTKQLALEAWRIMKRFNERNLPIPQFETVSPQNNQMIVTAIPEPLQVRRSLKFFIAETDDTGDPKYYGYVGNDYDLVGAPWYIMRVSGTSYRYFFGYNKFDDAWTIRASLPYDHAFKFKGFHDRYEIL